MTILVTGGAGYIGAHVVRLLQQRGERVVVVDNLSTGRADRIGDATLIELDVSEPGAVDVLKQAFAEHQVTGVIHFAAQKQVGESVAKPAWYYQQNMGGMTNLITAMEQSGVDRLVFSSSAAVYGEAEGGVLSEDANTKPINPYGQTKLIGEWLAAAANRAWGLKQASLRYFNVAGSGWDDLGDPAVLNLVPMVFERIEDGRRPAVFGTDYPTPDGTCIRDYVHVLDLAEAHLAALDHLDKEGGSHVFNIGTGIGASVLDVLGTIGKVTGRELDISYEDRRPGDPPELRAATDKIQAELGWQAKNGLPQIIESAWSAWRAARD